MKRTFTLFMAIICCAAVLVSCNRKPGMKEGADIKPVEKHEFTSLDNLGTAKVEGLNRYDVELSNSSTGETLHLAFTGKGSRLPVGDYTDIPETQLQEKGLVREWTWFGSGAEKKNVSKAAVTISADKSEYNFSGVVWFPDGEAVQFDTKADMGYASNQVFSVATAAIEEGVYTVTLMMCTEDVIPSQDENGQWVYEGNGEVASINFVTTDYRLPEGTYTAADCNVESPEYTVGTYLKGYEYMLFGIIPLPVYSAYFSVTDGQSEVKTYLDGGKDGKGVIKVGKSGEEYVITISTNGVEAEYYSKIDFGEEPEIPQKPDLPTDEVKLTNLFSATREDAAEGLYKYNLMIATEGLETTFAEGNWTYAGNGNYINLSIISSSNTLPGGTFTAADCSAEAPEYTDNTFLKGYEYMFMGFLPIPSFSTWFNVTEGNTAVGKYLTDGEVRIVKDGDNYTITTDCNGIKTRYSGTVNIQ